MWAYNNELYHFGILGMKWGQRRINRLSSKIEKSKKIGKEDIKELKEISKYHNNKDINKDISRSKQITNNQVIKMKQKQNKIKSKMDSQYSEGTQKAVSKISTGKSIIETMLMGSYGAAVYNTPKVHNNKKGKALTQAITNNWANNLTFGSLGKKAKW